MEQIRVIATTPFTISWQLPDKHCVYIHVAMTDCQMGQRFIENSVIPVSGSMKTLSISLWFYMNIVNQSMAPLKHCQWVPAPNENLVNRSLAPQKICQRVPGFNENLVNHVWQESHLAYMNLTFLMAKYQYMN